MHKIIGGIAVVALLIGVYAAFNHSTVVQTIVGSSSGPAVVDGCMEVNGVTTCSYKQTTAIASTTCAFRSPAATSTLLSAVANVRVSSIGALMQYEWGKSALKNATTTSLGLDSIAGGAQGTLNASTTVAQGLATTDVARTTTIAPNSYIALKIGSSTPTTQSGSCAVVLQY